MFKFVSDFQFWEKAIKRILTFRYFLSVYINNINLICISDIGTRCGFIEVLNLIFVVIICNLNFHLLFIDCMNSRLHSFSWLSLLWLAPNRNLLLRSHTVVLLFRHLIYHQVLLFLVNSTEILHHTLLFHMPIQHQFFYKLI